MILFPENGSRVWDFFPGFVSRITCVAISAVTKCDVCTSLVSVEIAGGNARIDSDFGSDTFVRFWSVIVELPCIEMSMPPLGSFMTSSMTSFMPSSVTPSMPSWLIWSWIISRAETLESSPFRVSEIWFLSFSVRKLSSSSEKSFSLIWKWFIRKRTGTILTIYDPSSRSCVGFCVNGPDWVVFFRAKQDVGL